MYKVGDEVLINAKICSEILEGIYEVRTENEGRVAVSDKEIIDKTYEMGLSDAWELAKKIVLKAEKGGFNYDDFVRVFGIGDYITFFEKMTVEEALAKIEAYEKEKSEIKVGDVVNVYPVSGGEYRAVVISVCANGYMDVLYSAGVVAKGVEFELIKKTGKHIDIESLLKEIGE